MLDDITSAELRTLREALGLTVQGAADLAGVSKPTWIAWEKPTYAKPIPRETVAVLLDRLDEQLANTRAIIGGAGTPPGPVRLRRHRPPVTASGRPANDDDATPFAALYLALLLRGFEPRVEWEPESDG